MNVDRAPSALNECPLRGAIKVATIDEMYLGLPNGAEFTDGTVIFEEIDEARSREFEYLKNYRDSEVINYNDPDPELLRVEDHNSLKGIFRLANGMSNDTDCLRQVRLVKPVPGTETNVWSGFVYIERCRNPSPDITPKSNVLDFAGPGHKRIRQVLTEFWFSQSTNGNACVFNSRVPPLDLLEGRTRGVNPSYKFIRTK